MRLLSGRLVLLVQLDGLVGFAGDQTSAGLIKGHGEDTRFRIEGAGLYGGLESLEVVACPPVPQVQRPVVGARDQDAVGVDGHAVHDRIVTGQVLRIKRLRQADHS